MKSMQSHLECKHLVVKKSLIHGYGVFADQDINENEIIEECYAINVCETVPDLMNFYYESKTHRIRNILPFGYGCIYNHSPTPNAKFEFDLTRSVLIIEAKQFIKRGEEIFISYGKNWFEDRKLRFKTIPRQFIIRVLAKIVLRFSIVTAVVFGLIFFLKAILIHFPFLLQMPLISNMF